MTCMYITCTLIGCTIPFSFFTCAAYGNLYKMSKDGHIITGITATYHVLQSLSIVSPGRFSKVA